MSPRALLCSYCKRRDGTHSAGCVRGPAGLAARVHGARVLKRMQTVLTETEREVTALRAQLATAEAKTQVLRELLGA